MLTIIGITILGVIWIYGTISILSDIEAFILPECLEPWYTPILVICGLIWPLLLAIILIGISLTFPCLVFIRIFQLFGEIIKHIRR